MLSIFPIAKLIFQVLGWFGSSLCYHVVGLRGGGGGWGGGGGGWICVLGDVSTMSLYGLHSWI